MDEPVLYKRVAEDIRQQILDGRLQPGKRLPSIRDLTSQWNCTPGTIQRAYNELAAQGLVASRAGQGTHVLSPVENNPAPGREALRQARLVHRAEAFILESLVAGQTLDEIQQAVSLAMDRWRAQRAQQDQPPPAPARVIRFAGSHDMAITWLAAHLSEGIPAARLEMSFTGSLGGLIALAEGRCDLAGCHLLDAATGEYNLPYVQRLFPGQSMEITHLAMRSIGLITAPGNPLNLQDIPSLARNGVRFINRQSGSGTRVYLDECLHTAGISPDQINGYANEVSTHSQAALAVAEGQADASLGLQSAASAYQLGFIPLVSESYDLVSYARRDSGGILDSFFTWLGSPETRLGLAILPGYDFSRSGERRIIDL